MDFAWAEITKAAEENVQIQHLYSCWNLQANDLNISNLLFLVELLSSGKDFSHATVLFLTFLTLLPQEKKKSGYDCSWVSRVLD